MVSNSLITIVIIYGILTLLIPLFIFFILLRLGKIIELNKEFIDKLDALLSQKRISNKLIDRVRELTEDKKKLLIDQIEILEKQGNKK